MVMGAAIGSFPFPEFSTAFVPIYSSAVSHSQATKAMKIVIETLIGIEIFMSLKTQ